MLVDLTAPAAPTVTLGSGINNATNNGATSTEAIASNGVISVGGESGAKVEATFSRDGSHSGDQDDNPDQHQFSSGGFNV